MALNPTQRSRVLIAFAAVYVCWGSTYAAIHIAGEHLPPPVVSATRSVLTTLLILTIVLASGKSLRVPRGEGPKLVLVGLLFMSGNNMLLTWGETMVPSGFASLIVSTMPIMIALMARLLPRGEPLHKRGWAGTLMGTAGERLAPAELIGMGVIVCAVAMVVLSRVGGTPSQKTLDRELMATSGDALE